MSRLEPPLAFVGVGVPKAGTTSLHEALKRHPQLVLPRGKEAPFFLQPEDRLTQEAWKAFVREVFPHTRGLLGKITPQYWYDPHMPEKLRRAFGPELRILVVLRDPVEVVLSAYRMHVRRGATTLSLKAFLDEGWGALDAARERYDPNLPAAARILAGGEYARILSRYWEIFSSSSLHVVFFEELVKTPDPVLREIQAFLGVEPRPLGFPHAHPARMPRVVRWVAGMAMQGARWLDRHPGVKGWVRRGMGAWRHEVRYWVQTHHAVRGLPQEISGETEIRRRLREFFGEDQARLQRLLGRSVPWREDASR